MKNESFLQVLLKNHKFWRESVFGFYLLDNESRCVVVCRYSLKLSCNSRFLHAFTACICVFKVITFVGSSQRDYFENTTSSVVMKYYCTVLFRVFGDFKSD